jgi:alpha-ribazole phosphatase
MLWIRLLAHVLFGKPASTFPGHALITRYGRGSSKLSDTATLDNLVASKAAKDGFVRTRWWWIRHAPVIVDDGKIYGQSDLPCDCSDARVFANLATLLPRNAVWLTSNLVRTHQTAQAIFAAGRFEATPELLQDKDLAEQHLGDWQGQDRRTFLMNRRQEPDSFWYSGADERAPNGESFVDLVERVGSAIARTNKKHQGSDIIAVAHGGTIRAAIAIALGLQPRGGFAFLIDNCSLTRLDHYQGADRAGWRVSAINHRP